MGVLNVKSIKKEDSILVDKTYTYAMGPMSASASIHHYRHKAQNLENDV